MSQHPVTVSPHWYKRFKLLPLLNQFIFPAKAVTFLVPIKHSFHVMSPWPLDFQPHHLRQPAVGLLSLFQCRARNIRTYSGDPNIGLHTDYLTEVIPCHRLRVFENWVLRTLFGLQRQEVVGGFIRLNEELHNVTLHQTLLG